MAQPSTTPRGEHAGRPGARWETVLRTTGELLITDNEPEPKPNRATRRAARKKNRTHAPKILGGAPDEPFAS